MFWIPEAKTVVPESVPNRVCRPPALMVPDIALPPVATVWVPAEAIWVLLAIADAAIAWVPPERMALVAIPPELMFWIPVL